MNIVYLIWALLPISLFLVGLYSLMRRHSPRKKMEDYLFCFKQALVAFVLFLIAIQIDKKIWTTLITATGLDYEWAQNSRLLIYLVVLLVAATISGAIKKYKEKDLPKRRYY